MKLVISIPDDSYDYIKGLARGYHDYATNCMLYHSVKNAVPYEERPRGEWIVSEYMDCHSDILPKYTCPFCGEVAYRKYDFCHCGADMRGGGK